MTARTYDDPNSIEARQGLLDRRCERTHPKRHWVRKRAKKISEAKRSVAKHKVAVNNAQRTRFLAAARAFWSGESDTHP